MKGSHHSARSTYVALQGQSILRFYCYTLQQNLSHISFKFFLCRSYGVLIWELVSGQDITEMQPLAVARQVPVRFLFSALLSHCSAMVLY